MSSRTIAILYGYEPSGHACAAQALSPFFARAGWKPILINLSTDFYPVLGPLVAKTYLKILQKTPALWDYVYDNETIARATDELCAAFLSHDCEKLRMKLLEKNVKAAVCTHSLACLLLSARKTGAMHIPLFAVLTDFTAHAYWPASRVQGYFVPDKSVSEELCKNGVPADTISVSGIPIREEFQRTARMLDARRMIGLSPDLPAVLISGGSKGLGCMEFSVKALTPLLGRLQLIVLCGGNKNLFRRIKSFIGDRKHVKIFDYVRSPAGLVSAADLILGKSGGVTIAETLVLGKPWIIFSPLPGQEERNAGYLVRHGVAEFIREKSLIRRVVERIVFDKMLLAGMSAHAAGLGKPDASQNITSEIVKFLHNRIYGTGRGADGSAPGSGPGGPGFESLRPDPLLSGSSGGGTPGKEGGCAVNS